MRPAQSSSSSHTGTLPGSEGSGVGQGPPQYPSTEEYAHGRECPQPTPRTHAVRAAGAAGSDYPLPQRTGLFRVLPGARVHGPFQAGRPRRSPRCRDTPSHSRGAGEERVSEGRPSRGLFPREITPLSPGGSLDRWARLAGTLGRGRPRAPPGTITWRENAMWMATEPVTIPRPRKVPDSLQPTGKYSASQQPLQGSPASIIAKDGSQGVSQTPVPTRSSLSHT